MMMIAISCLYCVHYRRAGLGSDKAWQWRELEPVWCRYSYCTVDANGSCLEVRSQ